jgi:hypothetical protein
LEGFISNGRLDDDDLMLGILLVNGVGRHGVDISALELLTIELNILFLKGEIGCCSGLETKRQRLGWDKGYI